MQSKPASEEQFICDTDFEQDGNEVVIIWVPGIAGFDDFLSTGPYLCKLFLL